MAVIIFEKVHKDLLDFLLNLVEENKCKRRTIEWRSKYNSYIVHSSGPLCLNGFEINVEIQGEEANLNFIQYLYNERVKQLLHLNKCFYQERMAGVI